MFQKYKVDNLQALIANYLTGAVCSYLFLETNFSLDYILHVSWLYHAIIIDTLFFIVFNLYSFGLQKVLISITAIMLFLIPSLKYQEPKNSKAIAK